MKKKKAFTLSELLITISIIGVVAAITIPAMVKDILKSNLEVGARESYAMLNNILKKINVDYECDNDLRCTTVFATGKNSQSIGTELARYLKVVNDCGMTTNQKCWPNNTNDNFDGTGANVNMNASNYYYKFISTNNVAYAVHSYTEDFLSDCANNGSTGALGTNSFMSQVCGVVVVDVNGYKKPNTRGKDTFIFYITNGKGPLVYPSGGVDDGMSSANNYWNQGGRDFCKLGTNTNGIYCTGRLVDKNWQMDYYN